MNVRMPDGTIIKNVPDGTTKADLLAKLQANGINVQNEAPLESIPRNTAVAENAANKAISGTIDTVLNAPTNVYNLGKAAVGTVARALGGSADMMPELTPTPDYARKLFEKASFVRPDFEPQTKGQRILDMGIQGGTSALMSPSSSVSQSLASALTGALSGGASQGTTELTGNKELGALVAALTPLAVNKGISAAQNKIEDISLKNKQNAPKIEAFEKGRAEGLVAPPGMVQPTATNKVIESIGGKSATQQGASIHNQQVMDDLSRRALNVPPETPLTTEVTRQVRKQAFDAGYAPIQEAGIISTGKTYRQSLDKIVDKYQGAERSFSGAVPDDVKNLVDGLRRRSFDAGDGIKMTEVLRENASKAFASGDTALAGANRSAAKAIEDQIELGLSNKPEAAKLVENFRAARKQMAIAHTVEDAIKEGTGSVDAKKYAAALQDGQPLSGELKIAAQFAHNFPKAVQNAQAVGSPGVSKVAALSSVLLGGGGGVAAGPVGSMVGAALPYVAPPAARSFLLSNTYQNKITPKIDPSLISRGLANLQQTEIPASLMPLLRYSEELRKQRAN